MSRTLYTAVTSSNLYISQRTLDMTETIRRSFLAGCTGDLTPRDRRNQMQYIALLFSWMVVYLLSTYAIVNEMVAAGPLAWLVAVLPSILAAAAMLAYIRFLREGDELLRAIHLRALALALGVGFVIWPAYQLLGRLGISLDAWNDLPIMAMIITYTAAAVLGQRHYA
jgi:hypothetical protein